jgi:hypothetical protein
MKGNDMLTLPKHPTYPDTDRPIRIGDLVVEPHGPGSEHLRFPSTVTTIDQKYVTIRSLATGETRTTYPCLIRPATDEELKNVDENLTPESIEDWKVRMRKMGAKVLVIHDLTSASKKSRHMVILPPGVAMRDIRPRDLVAPFVDANKVDKYDYDYLFVIEPDELRMPYEFEEVMFQTPVTIDAEPLTSVEKAFMALDRLAESGVIDDDTADIENALSEMARSLGMDVPKRTYVDPYDEYDEYDSWDD